MRQMAQMIWLIASERDRIGWQGLLTGLQAEAMTAKQELMGTEGTVPDCTIELSARRSELF